MFSLRKMINFNSNIELKLKEIFRLCELNIFSEEKLTKLCTKYTEFENNDKFKFLKLISSQYSTSAPIVLENAQKYINTYKISTNKNNLELLNSQESLYNSLTPQYVHLFKNIAKLKTGVKHLVDMRADLINPEKQDLECMNNLLKELLQIWFSIGLLDVERITWQSSCDMLQKISQYEAVHPVKNWTDLRKRVGPFRRCFAFTHKSMPGEPIVVLHTALTNTICNNIQEIVFQPKFRSLQTDNLSQKLEASNEINAAIFYSITSTQKGLQNVELGNHLIKKVVKNLQNEFPNMHKFSSLSPIPGFRKWFVKLMGKKLNSNKELNDSNSLLDKVFTPTVIAEINPKLPNYQEINDENPGLPILKKDDGPSNSNISDLELDTNNNFWRRMIRVLGEDITNKWVTDIGLQQLKISLEAPLVKLCLHYIYDIKYADGYATNPVANFHFRNGANFWRINWMADTSPRGLEYSFGIMINYRYYLNEVEENSIKYITEKFISISESLKSSLHSFPK
ncbi:malonyl-CoA decarboxylase, mitochondrial-like isoform X2 [Gordionus sp. m RMFG-2023]|uniref:malonyl-CoA decarboxylase, mitochondrial-like isoform X2 n=1 Tax=Gordionus sp. m RMFG-2023 TaxID=3053472 RepID=UPI0031FC113A